MRKRTLSLALAVSMAAMSLAGCGGGGGTTATTAAAGGETTAAASVTHARETASSQNDAPIHSKVAKRAPIVPGPHGQKPQPKPVAIKVGTKGICLIMSAKVLIIKIM